MIKITAPHQNAALDYIVTLSMPCPTVSGGIVTLHARCHTDFFPELRNTLGRPGAVLRIPAPANVAECVNELQRIAHEQGLPEQGVVVTRGYAKRWGTDWRNPTWQHTEQQKNP